jgi:hypothetical protein
MLGKVRLRRVQRGCGKTEVMSVDGGGKRRVELHCGASMADTGGSSGVRARRKSWEEASP